jgi:hypothetical protein
MSTITSKKDLQIGKTYAYVTNNYILGVYKGETTPKCGKKCRCELPADTEIFVFSNGQHGNMIFDVGLVKTD